MLCSVDQWKMMKHYFLHVNKDMMKDDEKWWHVNDVSMTCFHAWLSSGCSCDRWGSHPPPWTLKIVAFLSHHHLQWHLPSAHFGAVKSNAIPENQRSGCSLVKHAEPAIFNSSSKQITSVVGNLAQICALTSLRPWRGGMSTKKQKFWSTCCLGPKHANQLVLLVQPV